MTLGLFDQISSWERIGAPGADIKILRSFLSPSLGFALLERFIAETPWRQDEISLYGRKHKLPRLEQWYGDEGVDYLWSGIKILAHAWTPALQGVHSMVETHTGRGFNSCLLNLYRDGNDCVHWHRDDEPELGTDPIIASVSLGAERDFMLRHDDGHKISVVLNHGSLLLMGQGTQVHYMHELPRRKGVTGPRVNLTFRQMQAIR